MSSHKSVAKAPTKKERRETMARKREERAARAAHRKEKKAQAYLSDDMNFVSFKNQLNSMGLELKDIPGDGNCLFRALGDQLDGHSKNHLKHRQDVVEYMLQHRDDFEPFVEDDVPFQRHINNLKKPGTYAGNDVIVAFARLHGVTVVIHQLNSPTWQINGNDKANAQQLHISYHNGDHYSSVRKIGDTSNQPTSIKLEVDGKSQDTKAGDKKTQSGKQQYHVHHNGFTDEYTWQSSEPDDCVMEAEVYGNTGYYADSSVNYCDEQGVARATRTAQDYVESVARETGCQNQDLILETLAENSYDLDATVSVIMHFMATQDHGGHSSTVFESADSGIWSENGTGSRLFGDSSASNKGAKPKKQSMSSRETAKHKKQEKKARAMERHKQRLLGVETDTPAANNYSDDETVIVQNMGSLVI